MADLYKFIPDFKPLQVISALAGTVDWGQQYTGINKYREMMKTKGEGIKVAILDTGKPDHIDLNDNIKGAEDLTGNNDVADNQGHSSHCHGIIGGIDNDFGVIGIAPCCDLYAGKVLDNNGLCPGDYSWIIKGLEWAIDIKADVVNLSLGASINPPDKLYQVIKQATDSGMILVAASGNEKQQQVDYPGRYEEVIAVAAMTQNGQIANYSNVGPNLDFIAPGSDIYSTYLNNGYASLSGTSMSSPFLVGVAALMLSYHRNGGNHLSPIVNYKDLQEHIAKYEKGKLIDMGHGVGIGILDFNSVVAESGEISVCSVPQVSSSSMSTGCLALAFKWILKYFSKRAK